VGGVANVVVDVGIRSKFRATLAGSPQFGSLDERSANSFLPGIRLDHWDGVATKWNL